ncbi:MAG: LD-carboxypeptidase, partial [Leptolyngbya sp. SIO1D8]|nr:LD-carboxypeptidase [Leptolyngbya sp. SIO1D8]
MVQGGKVARRQLMKGLGAIAALTPLAATHHQAQANSSPILKPLRLKAGDIIGIVSPAGATFHQEDLDIVMDAVR